MTIANSANSVVLSGNGATTAWNFPFVGVSASNVLVYYTNSSGTSSLLTLGVDYTITLNAASPGQLWGIGGTVTYPLVGSPIAVGTSVTITRILPVEQLISISNQGAFYPQAVEQAIDTICMELQQVNTLAKYALQYNPNDPGPFTPLPPGVSARANMLLGFDGAGNLTPLQSLTGTATVSVAMTPVVEAATIAAATALLGINISTAMAPVCSASTIAAAVALLGLAKGIVIPCTASISGTSITLTRQSGTNAATESNGTLFSFICPSNASGPFSLAESTDSLAGATLYDQVGVAVTSLVSGQFCVVGWNTSNSAWSLVGYTQQTTYVPHFYTPTVSTGTWTCPSNIGTIYTTGCGGGGGGGGSGTSSGGSFTIMGAGAGGGGAQSGKLPLAVTPGLQYVWAFGSGGAGGTSGAGSNGGSTTLSQAGTVVLSWAGGLGGAYSATAGTSTGGAGGGSGGTQGMSGANGLSIEVREHAGNNIGYVALGGAGGGCALGAGGAGGMGGATLVGSVVNSVTPVSPGGNGGGGGGGAGGSNGAAGAPGILFWSW